MKLFIIKKYFIILFILMILVLITPDSASAQTYLNENDTWEQNLTGVYWSSLVFGDIDNDGKLDLILSGKCGIGCYASKIYINNGITLSENQTWEQNLIGVNYGSLALGDINNDGKLDLALSGCSNGGGTVDSCNDGYYQTLIYVNNGSTLIENFTWEQNLTKVWKGTISFEDIDNDGKLDMALTGVSSDGYKSKIYINNGTALNENSTWGQNLTSVYESSLAFGDIDNDGKVDLALCGDAGLSDETTKIYINNGTAFVENSTWQTNLLGVDWCSLTFGDYDNDGDLDLTLIGHTTQDNHRIYRNNGTAFVELHNEVNDLIGIFEGSLAFGDYNNDGYLDLISSGREGYTTLYIYNVSSSNFTTYTQDPESYIINLNYGPQAIWADLDNDSDLDLVEIGLNNSGGGTEDAKVYISNRSLTKNNTQPNPPASDFNTTFNFSTGKLTLSWGNGSDVETPALGLYYNLHVGTCSGCHDVVSGIYGGSSNPTAGYFGNMMQRKRIILNRPDLENKTVYWAVQTIDTGLAKSAWSTEQIYQITQQCTENWTYGAWSSCANNQQTRTATDSNNCGTTINRSTVVQSCSTGPSGPSGPSGPIITPPEEKPKLLENVTWYFEKINADVDTGFIVNESGLALNQVWIKVRNEVKEVAIIIKKLESKPATIAKEPEGKVYQYLNITTTNLSDTNVEIGKIRFRLEKSWLENNLINISRVYLLRYYGSEWQKLKTEFKSEDSEFVYYLAETPGFSIFAIAGEVLKEARMVCVPLEKKCVENRIEGCSIDGSEWTLKEVCKYGCENGKCNEKSGESFEFSYAWIIISLVIIVILIAGLYFSKINKICHKQTQTAFTQTPSSRLSGRVLVRSSGRLPENLSNWL